MYSNYNYSAGVRVQVLCSGIAYSVGKDMIKCAHVEIQLN